MRAFLCALIVVACCSLFALPSNATVYFPFAASATSTPTPGATPNAYSACLTPACANTGPRIATGPQSTTTCPPAPTATFVATQTSSQIQTIINSHAAGSTYCFNSGTYTQPSLLPQSGDTYVGIGSGVIFDGGSSATFAFYDYGGVTTNVTIKNLTIQNYAPSSSQGEIFASRAGSTGWTIQNNALQNSAAYGVYGVGGWNIVGNYIYNNGQGGYADVGGSGASITDNEISTNNTNQTSYPYASGGGGGGKSAGTTNLTVSYNYCHDNHGPGLWTDTNNVATTDQYNDSENNWIGGIMHEISWSATINYNYLAGNGITGYCTKTDQNCGAIFISNSGGQTGAVVDVSYNKVTASSFGGGITLLNITRGSGTYGTYLIQNVHVHNNGVNLGTGGVFGAVDYDSSDPAMFTTQGNSLDYDAFTGAGTSSLFFWGEGAGGVLNTFTTLQSDGQETHGTST